MIYAHLKKDEAYTFRFPCKSLSTGLMQTSKSSFTVKVRKPDDTLLSPDPTVSEITTGSPLGEYKLSFTPDAVGRWAVKVSQSTMSDIYVEFLVANRQIDDVLPTASYVAPDNATVGTINTNVGALNTKIGTPTGVSISADLAAIQTTVDANELTVLSIQDRTDELPASFDALTTKVYEVRDTALDIRNKTDNLPALPASEEGSLATNLQTIHDRIGFPLGEGTVSLELAAISSQLSDLVVPVVAIQERTDNLPDDPASATGPVGSVTGNVEGSVAGNVGGSLFGSVHGELMGNVGGHLGGSVLGDLAGNVLGNIEGTVESVADPSGIADAVWDELLTQAQHNISGSAGKILRQSSNGNGPPGGDGTGPLGEGTAQGPGNGVNQIQLANGDLGTDGIYADAKIAIVSGTGSGQSRFIVHYAGDTKIVTVDTNWVTPPDDTSDYEIYPGGQHTWLAHGLAQGGTTTTLILRESSSAEDDFYRDAVVAIVSGAGRGQARLIFGYSGDTKTVTFSRALAVTPDNTSAYVVLPVAHVVARELIGYTAPDNSTISVINDKLGAPTGASLAEDVASIQTNTDLLPDIKDRTDEIEALQTDVTSIKDISDTILSGVNNAQSDVSAVLTVVNDKLDMRISEIEVAVDYSAVADAVWDEGLEGHVTGGTAGKTLADAATGAVLADVKERTDNLPDDPASATGPVGSVTGNVEGSVAGNVGGSLFGSVHGELMGNVGGSLGGSVLGDVAGHVYGNVADISNPVALLAAVAGVKADTEEIQNTIDNLPAPDNTAILEAISEVKDDTSGIKEKTDNLPDDPAGASDIDGAVSGVLTGISTEHGVGNYANNKGMSGRFVP